MCLTLTSVFKGQWDWKNATTLPNIIKMFNPSVNQNFYLKLTMVLLMNYDSSCQNTLFSACGVFVR